MALCPVWLVVGGESRGGIIVRKEKGTSSAQLPERLCTGALVRQLDYSAEACRLCFERVTGTGPDTGWVSTKLVPKDLVVKTSEGWRVVGGTERGGLVVRERKDTSSKASPKRLQTGALVEEIEFLSGSFRLHFRKVSGGGPDDGWVTTRASESEMLVRLKEWDPRPGRSLPTLDLTKAETVEEACAFARRSRRALLRLLEDVGGVLVDAPALHGPNDFRRCLREVFGESIAKDYTGLVTRKKASESVFETTPVPSNMPIPGHTELSYMPGSKPDWIAFFCEEAPSGAAGQTPAIDMREVLRDLPEDIVQRFRKGVRCSTNFAPEPGKYLIPSQLDPSEPRFFRRVTRNWKRSGATQAEATVGLTSSAEAAGSRVFIESDGDWLQKFEHMPAIAPHPVTGEFLWTGYNPRFHWFGTLSQALFDVAFYNHTWRQLLVTLALTLSTLAFALCRFLARLPSVRGRLPAFLAAPGVTSSVLEDGSAISAWDAFRITWCYNRHTLSWHWTPGLFVLLDNHRLGHFRTPYDPHEPRKVYTAFGSLFDSARS